MLIGTHTELMLPCPPLLSCVDQGGRTTGAEVSPEAELPGDLGGENSKRRHLNNDRSV